MKIRVKNSGDGKNRKRRTNNRWDVGDMFAENARGGNRFRSRPEADLEEFEAANYSEKSTME